MTQIIVLARGDAFPDALVAAGVAMQCASHVVLLTETDRLPDATARALEAFDGPSGKPTIYILGDRTAVSDAVGVRLERDGWRTIRLAGDTRYDTAAKAALAIAEERVILLTPPDRLHPAARAALQGRDVVTVGGHQRRLPPRSRPRCGPWAAR